MPAQGKVKIIWQLVFALFIPVLDIWAFYRIKKLRKMILYIELPMSVFLVSIIIFIISSVDTNLLSSDDFLSTGSSEELMLSGSVSGVGILFSILSLYFIYKWSVEWNKQFS